MGYPKDWYSGSIKNNTWPKLMGLERFEREMVSLLSNACSKFNSFKFYDSDPQRLTAFKYVINTNPRRVGPMAHRTLQHGGMCYECLARRMTLIYFICEPHPPSQKKSIQRSFTSWPVFPPLSTFKACKKCPSPLFLC